MPFSCPNSSDSIRSFGIAPVCTGTNGPALRDERSWTARATSSLPVPVSPTMSTVASVCATAVMLSNTACITAERASMPSNTSSSELLGVEQRVGQIRGPLGDELRDQLLELRHVHRLLQVVDGAELERGDRRRHRGVAGHDHDGGGRRLIAQLAHQIEPALAGQLNVGDDDGVGSFAELRQRGLRRGRRLDFVTGVGEERAQSFSVDPIVVDDEDPRRHAFLCLRLVHVDVVGSSGSDCNGPTGARSLGDSATQRRPPPWNPPPPPRNPPPEKPPDEWNDWDGALWNDCAGALWNDWDGALRNDCAGALY